MFQKYGSLGPLCIEKHVTGEWTWLDVVINLCVCLVLKGLDLRKLLKKVENFRT